MEKRLRHKLKNGNFMNLTPQRSRTMKAIKAKNNSTTEARLRFALVSRGIRGWKMHVGVQEGRPDFFFPEQKVAIFVDGCFWHGCPDHGHIPSNNRAFWKAKIESNTKRDRATRDSLSSIDIRVLRFWEHSLKDDLEACVDRVQNALYGNQ
jgi:DNA mismatch endonuclease (patch repair protein)